VKPSELKPHPLNWRLHPKEQRAALRMSVDELGIVDAIVCREQEDGSLQIIDGHLRSEELASEKEIPVLVTDLSAKEADRALLSLDPITGMASKDADALKKLFDSIKAKEDPLIQAVWPDHEVDPLVGADWIPSHDGSNLDDYQRGVKVSLTKSQHKIFEQACEKLRASEDGEISEGRCLELICAEFLS